MTRSVPIAIACAALVCLPGAVRAEAATEPFTYCVVKPSCTGLHVVPVGTFDDALEMAETHPGEDFIELGPETFYTKSGWEYDSGGTAGNHVKISGTYEKTVLRTVDEKIDAQGFRLMTLKGAGSSGSYIANVELQLPGSNDSNPLTAPTGLGLLDASAEDVRVTVLPGAGYRIRAGIELMKQARVRFGDVSLGTHTGAGIRAYGDGDVIEDVEVSGGSAGIALSDGDGQLARARVDARGSAAIGIQCLNCEYAIDDASIRVDGDDTGLSVWSGSSPSQVDASHITIVGQPPNSAVAVEAWTAGVGNALARIDNCILHTVAKTLKRTADPAAPAVATIVTRNCNYGIDKESESGPGWIDDAAGHTSHGPDFVDYSGGNFRLKWSSPLIDAGRSSTFAASPWALDMAKRVIDGNGDGSAAPDLGAYEYQAVPPVALITGPAMAVAGEPLTLDGSTSHGGENGEPVTYAWKLDGAALATTPAVTITPPPGPHKVLLTVTDPSGRTSTALKLLSVAAPPADEPPAEAPADPAPEPEPVPTPEPVEGPVEAPVEGPVGGGTVPQQPQAALLASVRVEPRIVRRGRRARAQLTLGQPAQVQVRLERRSDGRWRAKRTLARSLPAGPVRVALPRRLAAGRWRAVVSAGGATATTRFRVV